MASMKLIVFNVEQGQCVYIRTPNDYGILIDCGRSGPGDVTSPVEWLAENEAPSLKHYGGHPIALMIVTHPHGHHTEDMNTLMERLSPAALWRDTDCEGQAIPETDLGVTVRDFSLDQQEAGQLGGNEQSVVNNRSIVTVVTYNSPEGYTWKVVVPGDNETKGWEALLANPEFCTEIAGADFFVTSHHGNESGYCADLFKSMGKPLANISSTRGDDEPADGRYKKQAKGVKFPDGSRTHFITRDDGNITVEMQDDGRYDVWLYTP